MNLKKIFFPTLLLFFCSVSNADNRKARQYIRRGNLFYHIDNIRSANVYYHKARQADSTDSRAIYNIATSMFKKEWKNIEKIEGDTIINYLYSAANHETNPIRKAFAYHNIGVVYQNEKKFGKAIEAYKEALRNNPNDDETRYNLVLCQRQMKDNNNGENNQNQNQGEDKGNNKQDEQQNNKQQKQDSKNNKEQHKEEQQQPLMNKETAEQLLKAAMQQEKKTQEHLKQTQPQSGKRTNEKNW